ncbi:MAG: hypothetical protein PGN13_13410, partial [Patulibacter minatonensis]
MRRFLLDETTWLERRVETVELLSSDLVRRRVSIDASFAAADLRRMCVDGVHYVPIATLRKAPLRNFDLLAAGGASIPAITKSDHALIATAALVEQATLVLGAAGSSPSAPLLADLHVVASGTTDEAAERLGRLRMFAEHGEHESATLIADDDMYYLLQRLADTYLLIGIVADPPSRLVIKMRYVEPLFANPSLPQRLGLAPVLVVIDVPGAAGGASFHAEVVIPDEVRIQAAFLFDETTDEVLSIDEHADRGSLYASGVSRDARPQLLLGIRAERAGFPTMSAALALLTTIVLALGAAFSKLDPAKSGPAITVLLAGSALFSGSIVRAGEHRLVRSIFVGPRVLLAVVALAALVAATSLALVVPHGVVRVIWPICAGSSFIATTLLVAGCWRAAPRSLEELISTSTEPILEVPMTFDKLIQSARRDRKLPPAGERPKVGVARPLGRRLRRAPRPRPTHEHRRAFARRYGPFLALSALPPELLLAR